ncbi:MAG: TetR/AcrR family transcriptional regulator [Ignavibacteriaceae bacterium]|jgi:AcrR family transcriptional regulator
MNRRKKKKPIIAGVEAFPGENSYPGKINGSKDANIYVKKSEEIKEKNIVMDIEEREKILGYAVETFLKEGFYKTTMDEIAARLHMSKKTIYKYFPSKEELVREVMKTHMHLTMKKIKSHVNHQSNAVEKLFDIFTIVGENILKVNEKMIMDLQFYSPGIWKEVDDFRARQITANFSRIFEQGKAEDYFLNIKTEIILSVFVASIRAIVNPDYAVNSGVSLKEAFMAIIEILMNGILNEKGKKIFNKLKNGVTK